jgi:hypothetical protein
MSDGSLGPSRGPNKVRKRGLIEMFGAAVLAALAVGLFLTGLHPQICNPPSPIPVAGDESVVPEFREELLRFTRVMIAVDETEGWLNIQRRAKGDPLVVEKLESDLYQRIVKNVKVELIGKDLIRVQFTGRSPSEAFIVLDRLICTFVEKSLLRWRTDARRARAFAQRRVDRITKDLVTVEAQIDTFDEDHPDFTVDGGPRRKLETIIAALNEMDAKLAGTRRQIDWCAEYEETAARWVVRTQAPTPPSKAVELVKRIAKLTAELRVETARAAGTEKEKKLSKQLGEARTALDAIMTKAGNARETIVRNPVLASVASKQNSLELDLEELLERRRALQLRKGRFEEEAHAVPSALRQWRRFNRERAGLAQRYTEALRTLERVDRQFNSTMECLESPAVIVDPPRKPARGNTSAATLRITPRPSMFRALLKEPAPPATSRPSTARPGR